jgi:hypothetical protein
MGMEAAPVQEAEGDVLQAACENAEHERFFLIIS